MGNTVSYEYSATVAMPIQEGDVAKVEKPRRLQGNAAAVMKQYGLRAFVHDASKHYVCVTLTGGKSMLEQFMIDHLPKPKKGEGYRILTTKIDRSEDQRVTK